MSYSLHLVCVLDMPAVSDIRDRCLSSVLVPDSEPVHILWDHTLGLPAPDLTSSQSDLGAESRAYHRLSRLSSWGRGFESSDTLFHGFTPKRSHDNQQYSYNHSQHDSPLGECLQTKRQRIWVHGPPGLDSGLSCQDVPSAPGRTKSSDSLPDSRRGAIASIPTHCTLF